MGGGATQGQTRGRGAEKETRATRIEGKTRGRRR